MIPTTPATRPTEAEAVENLFFFNCVGEDHPTGRFELDDDQLRPRWADDPADQKVFRDVEGLARDFCEAIGGRYVPILAWKDFGDKR